MKTSPVILRGEATLHLLRRVRLETLRRIVDDLDDATFGDEHIYASILAQSVLNSREITSLEAADTLVTEPIDD